MKEEKWNFCRNHHHQHQEELIHHCFNIQKYQPTNHSRCKKCNGRKVNRERKILEVSVDKGMEDGQKVTFSGEGDQEPGLEPGDIIIVLDEKAHALFKRNGQVDLDSVVQKCYF